MRNDTTSVPLAASRRGLYVLSEAVSIRVSLRIADMNFPSQGRAFMNKRRKREIVVAAGILAIFVVAMFLLATLA